MSSQRFVILVNPRGGTRRAESVLETVRPVFAAANAELDVRVTAYAGHARELAATMNLDGCDGLCVVGGDGTIHEVINGLMQRQDGVSTTLGVIPGGTGNSVAHHLQCLDAAQAATRITAGHVQPLDVFRVTMADTVTYCVNIVGWGAVVDVNRTAERLRRLGPPRYGIAAISHILRARHRPAQLLLDDQLLEDEFLFAAACNTKFTGKGMQLAPRAEIGNGQIEVVFVRRASRLQILKLFQKVFDGSHVALDCVECRQVRSLRITPCTADVLNLDGELGGTTPVEIEILPAALNVYA